MKLRLTYLIVMCASSLASFFAVGQNEFSEGLDAYAKKNYGEAVEKFEHVVSTAPADVSAWYNLGLANIGRMKYGEAIWNFEKVLKLTPNDGEASEKISYCYTELYNDRLWAPRLNSIEASLYSYSSTTWSIVSICLSIILAVSLIVRAKQKHQSLRNTLTLIASILAFLMIGAIAVGFKSQHHATESNVAIVTKTTIPTFIEAGKTAKSSLREGTRVEFITPAESEFIQVVTDQGENCMVRLDDLSII